MKSKLVSTLLGHFLFYLLLSNQQCQSFVAQYKQIMMAQLQLPRRRWFSSLSLLLGLVALWTGEEVSASKQHEAVMSARGAVHVNDEGTTANGAAYGVDCSWPMQHQLDIYQANCPFDQSHRQRLYKEYMQGCSGENEVHLQDCRRWEDDRMQMNYRQPAISQNYTYAGYAKVETPRVVQDILQDFWDLHFGTERQVVELWERSNTYLNHWNRPTQILDIEHTRYGLSQEDRWTIVKAVQSVLEAWTQQPLVLTSIYGIRLYGQDAILAPHLDRLPLVSSAILNVAQDVDADWMLELIDHDGLAHNVSMAPGDMVLYESHSVIHGRPSPLQGKYFANLFVHFEPLGHSVRHTLLQGGDDDEATTAKVAYERAMARQIEQEQSRLGRQSENEENDVETPTPHLPPYIHPEMEVRWKQQFEYEKEVKIAPKPTKVTLGALNAHHAASDGMLDILKEIASKDRSQLFKADHNGWRPLHEAARSGRAKTVQYLLEEGANAQDRTNDDEGGNALWWALRKPRENAAAIAVLKGYGAVSLAPKSVVQKEAADKTDTNKN